MNLICLLNSAFISFTNSQIFVDILQTTFSVNFILRVKLVYSRQGITNWTHIMILLLLHVPVHALHTHHTRLLFTIKHQSFFMKTTFNLKCAIPCFTTIINCSRIMTGLTTSFKHLGSSPLSVNVTPSLSIRHFPKSAFTNSTRSIPSELLL